MRKSKEKYSPKKNKKNYNSFFDCWNKYCSNTYFLSCIYLCVC